LNTLGANMGSLQVLAASSMRLRATVLIEVLIVTI
jgi:hypothetical protein